MSAKRGKPKPRRGDVVHVEVGEPTDPVRIRLHGHPFTYCVQAALSKETGPELAELTMVADDGAVIDYEALRAVPARRLAYTAAQAIERKFHITGGGEPGEFETHGRLEKPSTAYLAAKIADTALALGLPVRPTIAARLGVSKTTVDRLLKRAKAEGWFEDAPLPKRPPPQQRDATDSLGLSDSFTAATTTEGNQ